MISQAKLIVISAIAATITVLLNRVILTVSITDLNDFSSSFNLALLSISFFFVCVIFNTVIFTVLFKREYQQQGSKKTRLFQKFFISFCTSMIFIFFVDWLYDEIIDNSISQYLAQVLLASLDNPKDEVINLLTRSPLLVQNSIVNVIGIVFSWVLIVVIAHRHTRQKRLSQ